MTHEIEQLTGVDSSACFTSATTAMKADQVFKFLTSKCRLRSLNAIEVACQATSTSIPKVAGMLLLLLEYFKEDDKRVLVTSDKELNQEDLERLPDLPQGIFIFAHGPEFLRADQFSLVVDGMVCFHSFCPLQAVQALIMGYFVMNRHYPAECGATFEFFQRLILGINPSEGTRIGRKKGKTNRSGSHPAVLKLAREAAAFSFDPSL